jgi:hypothetical protein
MMTETNSAEPGLDTCPVPADALSRTSARLRTTSVAQERDFARELAAMLGRGFRAALLQAGGTATAPPPGRDLTLPDGNRRVESLTATARGWLDELALSAIRSTTTCHMSCSRSPSVPAEDATARVPGPVRPIGRAARLTCPPSVSGSEGLPAQSPFD